MNWQPATDTPTRPGWYCVRIRLSNRPVVLWWSLLQTQWRDGMQLVQVVEWMGPL